jgi:Aspartyl/Asparaginyl beta-hydroxylase
MNSPYCIKLPITFDLNESLEYYQILQKDFQPLKWDMPVLGFRHTNEEIIPTITGWAIQTPKDINEPHCMIEDADIQGKEFAKETPCAFGFAKKLIDFFPTAFRMYITVNSPGVVVVPHVDTIGVPRTTCKIIIPIQTNEKATWSIEDDVFHLDAGSLYLMNTSITHSTKNEGTTDRVHIMLEFFEEEFEVLKNMSGHI